MLQFSTKAEKTFETDSQRGGSKFKMINNQPGGSVFTFVFVFVLVFPQNPNLVDERPRVFLRDRSGEGVEQRGEAGESHLVFLLLLLQIVTIFC